MDTDPWEYHTEVVKNTDVRTLRYRLNHLGAQGWELVSTVSTVKGINFTGNDLVFLFKRHGTGPYEKRPEDDPN